MILILQRMCSLKKTSILKANTFSSKLYTRKQPCESGRFYCYENPDPPLKNDAHGEDTKVPTVFLYLSNVKVNASVNLANVFLSVSKWHNQGDLNPYYYRPRT